MDFVYPVARHLVNSYFGINNRRGGGRRGRRGGRGRSGRSRGAGVPSLPPTRSVMQGSFQGSIRQFFSVPESTTFYKSLNIKELLGDAYSSLAGSFSEARVHSVRAYYQPSYGTTQAGSYAACIFDAETASSSSILYKNILASPGSTSRKSYQSVGLHWKWTEPSDADFISYTLHDRTVCVIQIAGAGQTKIAGDVIVDAGVTLRNYSNSVTGLRTHLDFLTSIPTSEIDGLSEAFTALCVRSLN